MSNPRLGRTQSLHKAVTTRLVRHRRGDPCIPVHWSGSAGRVGASSGGPSSLHHPAHWQGLGDAGEPEARPITQRYRFKIRTIQGPRHWASLRFASSVQVNACGTRLPPADEERSCFIWSEETWVLLELRVTCFFWVITGGSSAHRCGCAAVPRHPDGVRGCSSRSRTSPGSGMAGGGGERFGDTANCHARQGKLPRGALGPLAPERRRHPRLDHFEWTSAEAQREVAHAGIHDRVHEIFSSTGQTVRPRKVIALFTLACSGRRPDPIVPRHPLRVSRSVGKRRSHRRWIILSRSPGTVRV